MSPTRPQPRESPAGDVVDCLHGVEVRNPHRWLEDAGAQEVKAWTAGQTQFLEAALSGFPGRRALTFLFQQLRIEGPWQDPVVGS